MGDAIAPSIDLNTLLHNKERQQQGFIC